MRSAPHWVSPDDAEQRETEAEMRESGAPGGARQPGGAARHRGERCAQQPDALDDVGDGAGDDEQREPDPERRQQGLAFEHEGRGEPDQGHHEGARQALGDAREIAALPDSSGPNGTATRSEANSGPKVALKNGAPTEIFSPVMASSASG